MKKIMFMLVFFSLIGCKDENVSKLNEVSVSEKNPIESLKIEDGRLVFKDIKHYNAVFNYLNLNKELEFSEVIKKIKNYHSFNPLTTIMKANDTLIKEFENIPSSVISLLNTDKEYKIGDDIVWINKGKKHFINSKENGLLSRIKGNPALSKRKGDFGSKVIGLSKNLRVNIGANGGDARNQLEFWQQSPASGHRKYVHEIIAFTEYLGSDFQFDYYGTHWILRLKLEWRGCCGWNPAGESRNMTVSVSGNAHLYGFSLGGGYATRPFSHSQSYNNYSGNKEILMDVYSGPVASSIAWDVEMNGSIYHHVVGDVSGNAWTNSGGLW